MPVEVRISISHGSETLELTCPGTTTLEELLHGMLEKRPTWKIEQAELFCLEAFPGPLKFKTPIETAFGFDNSDDRALKFHWEIPLGEQIRKNPLLYFWTHIEKLNAAQRTTYFSTLADTVIQDYLIDKKTKKTIQAQRI